MSGLNSLIAAVLLASIYVMGGKLRLGAKAHRRRWLSLAAGVATAYVFVQLLPEMYEAQETFTKATAGGNLLFAERRVYTSALIGFVVLYGLQHMVASSRSQRREESSRRESVNPIYWLHIGGFCIYSAMVSYLMTRESDWGLPSLILYFIAMSLHFLGTDHSLRREYGALYDRSGRWVLAGGVMLGWALSILGSVSEPTLATLMGFIGGGVVINSVIAELPKENEGRFWYFCAGAISYAFVLLLI